MELNLEGKSVIITGGSAGIGLAAAKAFVAEGANVLIIGRDKDRLQEAKATLKAARLSDHTSVHTVSADMTEEESIHQAFLQANQLFTSIDILVNNAGAAKAGSFFEIDDSYFTDAWTLKFLGYVRMVRLVGKEMIQQKSGTIINIVGAAARTPSPSFLPGSTTNAAIINFTRGIAKELAPHHVTINAISPGYTATERAERLAGQQADMKNISVEEAKRAITDNIPLGEMVRPEEVANMALLLASGCVRSMTGTEVIVDGGQQPGI
ncbi:SDR family NAD(P)-dependent oxidoreductase [Alteribacillus iranensis]|uniref:3-oxoacyl-[acyl-carrier protein] reductase/bacilysin biosynthesis oxidoreductase BacG n=1 Tax=Alteribacillus iranensis TaxID=930128 RepID=A0A1I2BPI5_9BACI|nr:SDR family NAD(P)-dependent oxidoreductase [Alteribacillus iranensis]SFE57768.1 3-oxoacyl-[acyl-carrier protein] reductase/bacilysin biosynthesis oxidoreductase BacG [Alteribacillus iranensis]